MGYGLLCCLLGERGVEESVEAQGVSEAEERVVESAKTGLATYRTNVVDVALIVASAIPAANRTTLLG